MLKTATGGNRREQSQDALLDLLRATIKTSPMNSIITLSPQQLRRAANVKEKIDSLQRELANILGDGSPTIGNNSSRSGRKLSSAARARISAAAKKRWANIRRSKLAAAPKRSMSAATKARLAAVARARWKRAKAEGKTAL
jgi:hypothetical protein